MDAALWNLDRSIRELAQLRAALGLKKIHLMGHSWGGSLVAAYLLKARPKGIASVILGAPLLSTRLWLEDANVLLAELPKDVQATLKRHEQAGTTQSKEYQEAAEVFYSRFLYHRTRPPLPPSCGESKDNDEIYTQMWGPSEFTCTGTLRDFDVTPGLPHLKLPVLFVVGRFDEARPETAARFQAMIPGARLEVIEGCGHMAPLEDPEAYVKVLRAFLGRR
jgi:proline iminopeptidase